MSCVSMRSIGSRVCRRGGNVWLGKAWSMGLAREKLTNKFHYLHGNSESRPGGRGRGEPNAALLSRWDAGPNEVVVICWYADT
jgi:hypothetical protein